MFLFELHDVRPHTENLWNPHSPASAALQALVGVHTAMCHLRCTGKPGNVNSIHHTGQWIESITDCAVRNTDWCLFSDRTSSHAQFADPVQPMPLNIESRHAGLPIAFISRLPD